MYKTLYIVLGSWNLCSRLNLESFCQTSFPTIRVKRLLLQFKTSNLSNGLIYLLSEVHRRYDFGCRNVEWYDGSGSHDPGRLEFSLGAGRVLRTGATPRRGRTTVPRVLIRRRTRTRDTGGVGTDDSNKKTRVKLVTGHRGLENLHCDEGKCRVKSLFTLYRPRDK